MSHTNNKDNRIVTLVSGGIDSLATEVFLINSSFDVYPFFIDYGQKSYNNELDALSKFNNYLYKIHGKKLHPTKIYKLENSLFSDNLITNTKEIPNENSKYDFYVPMRNLIFLSLASAYASSLSCTTLATGSHKEIPEAFPDSSPIFTRTMEETLSKASNKKWTILTPFINDYKSSIIKFVNAFGSYYNYPINLSFSCYSDKKNHCGICKACRDRKKAFLESGIEDITVYNQ